MKRTRWAYVTSTWQERLVARMEATDGLAREAVQWGRRRLGDVSWWVRQGDGPKRLRRDAWAGYERAKRVAVAWSDAAESWGRAVERAGRQAWRDE